MIVHPGVCRGSNWESAEGKTLDTHIRRIRAKIEADPSSPSRIVTVRKVGYRFNRPKR